MVPIPLNLWVHGSIFVWYYPCNWYSKCSILEFQFFGKKNCSYIWKMIGTLYTTVWNQTLTRWALSWILDFPKNSNNFWYLLIFSDYNFVNTSDKFEDVSISTNSADIYLYVLMKIWTDNAWLLKFHHLKFLGRGAYGPKKKTRFFCSFSNISIISVSNILGDIFFKKKVKRSIPKSIIQAKHDMVSKWKWDVEMGNAKYLDTKSLPVSNISDPIIISVMFSLFQFLWALFWVTVDDKSYLRTLLTMFMCLFAMESQNMLAGMKFSSTILAPIFIIL